MEDAASHVKNATFTKPLTITGSWGGSGDGNHEEGLYGGDDGDFEDDDDDDNVWRLE